MTLFDLKGRVAVVTGGNGGIGLGMARGLAQAGAAVAIAGRNVTKAQAAATELAQLGVKTAVLEVDVAEEAQCRKMVADTVTRLGRLDILVNNAGVGYRSPLLETRRSEITEMIETDLAAAIYLTQASLHALLRAAPSDIVNVSSIAGLEGFAEGTVYCAAKSGLVGFSRALTQELKPANIRVTAICPGALETDFFERFRPTLERPQMLRPSDAVRALMYVLTSPPNVLHGEIVLRPRVV